METPWKTPTDLVAILVGRSAESQNGKVCNMRTKTDDDAAPHVSTGPGTSTVLAVETTRHAQHQDTGADSDGRDDVAGKDLSGVSTERHLRGAISKFDAATWWGEVAIDDRRVEFHASCFIGASTRYLPCVGDSVLVTFSDGTRDRLLSVQSVPSQRAPRSEHDSDGDRGRYVQPFDRGRR